MGRACIFSFVITSAIYLSATDAAQCKKGWTEYKDELCFKIFDTLLSYDQAKDYCSAKGNVLAHASLAMVKDSDSQDFLNNFTRGIHDNIWIGGSYDDDIAQFIWDDGEELNYTNWRDDLEATANRSNVCMELSPSNYSVPTNSIRKWSKANCKKRNLVMCQRILTWTLQDAVDEIRKLRTELQATKQVQIAQASEYQAIQEKLSTQESKLQTMEQKISLQESELKTIKTKLASQYLEMKAVSSRVIPIGSVYIEYFNQSSPTTLWPELKWEDISNTYAGLFFRVSGGGSEKWGETQSDCSPRINQTQYGVNYRSSFANPLDIPPSGWSYFGWVGEGDHQGCGTVAYKGVRFHTQGCEVRPRNQAVRIWRRAL